MEYRGRLFEKESEIQTLVMIHLRKIKRKNIYQKIARETRGGFHTFKSINFQSLR